MTSRQKTTALIAVFLSAVLIYLLSPVLTPFFIAIFLAYIGNPLVDKLQGKYIPRTFAVIVVFSIMIVLLLLLLVFLIPLLEHQVTRLIANFPVALNWLQNVALPWISEHFGIQPFEVKPLTNIITEHWQQASNFAALTWKTVTESGLTLLGWIANLFLIPVVTFYLLRDWHHLIANFRALLPRHFEVFICQLFAEFDEVLSAFFRGQLLVMLAVSIIYTIGLWIAGLNLALLIGVISGLFTIVPYLGFVVGITAASIAAFAQFQDWTHVGYVWIVFIIANVVENSLLTPYLVGDRIGLHPIAVLFAIFCGGQLFGFLGVLLALPVAAVITVLLHHVRDQYVKSRLYTT